MAEEKPTTPPPVPVNQDITAGKPASSSNQTTTQGDGKPAHPPNTDTTKGGGK